MFIIFQMWLLWLLTFSRKLLNQYLNKHFAHFLKVKKLQKYILRCQSNPICKFQNKYLKENVFNFVTFLMYLPWQYLNICFIFFKVQGLSFLQITWIVLLVFYCTNHLDSSAVFLLYALHFYIENCSAYFNAPWSFLMSLSIICSPWSFFYFLLCI